MKYICLILAILLISCQEDTNTLMRYSMKDGTILYIQEDVHNYESANSFLNVESNFRPKILRKILFMDMMKSCLFLGKKQDSESG